MTASCVQVTITGEDPDLTDRSAIWRACSVTEWAMWFGLWVTPKWLVPNGDDVRRHRNMMPRNFDARKQAAQLALYGFNQREAPGCSPARRIPPGAIDLTASPSPQWNAHSPFAKRTKVRTSEKLRLSCAIAI